MRIHRIGKRIHVHGVPSDTIWFCPYCCATVDMTFLTFRGTVGGMCTSARLTHLSSLSRTVSATPVFEPSNTLSSCTSSTFVAASANEHVGSGPSRSCAKLLDWKVAG